MRIALNVCALSACAFVFGCDMPNYRFADHDPGDAAAAESAVEIEAGVPADASAGDGGCATDPDCADKFGTPYCQSSTGQCVQCLTSERCGQAQWCDAGTCVDGCKDDSDCAASTDGGSVAAKCDPTTHMCFGCRTDDDCLLGFICKSDGICWPGCTATHACRTDRECCEGTCVSTTQDEANCGACGNACATVAHTTMKCEPNGTGKGTCKVGSCAAGWADCNGEVADGCETDIATSLVHCGGCDTRCNIPNGWGRCESGLCKIATCNTGFANCDGVDRNGCEINLGTNVDHCGACNNACPSTAGIPACVGGTCKFAMCSSGLGDCDGSGTCATQLTNNVENCGACGRACVVMNGTPTCDETSCAVSSCNTGYGNCNSLYADGCEQKLDTLANCGACNATCSRANATATCTGGSCKIAACNAAFGNCDLNDANGCERYLLNDVNNCGACSKRCTVTNGTASCSAGVCTIGSCNAGFANCDGNAADCERNLATAANACSSPQTLLDASGMDLCGYGAGDTVTTSTIGTRYYRVRLASSGCSGGVCKASTDPVRAKLVLTNPSGAAYDLRVFSDNACSVLLGASTSGVLGGTETVTYDSMSCNSDRYLWIEVKYRTGASCTATTLMIDSGYTPYQ